MTEIINITEPAKSQIELILAEENNPDLKIRMFVQGGGCSGFQYGFTMDELQNDDDFVIEAGTAKVLVDSMSYQYLIGATLDFKDDLEGARFSISNPKAQSTCGCGSSFSPY